MRSIVFILLRRTSSMGNGKSDGEKIGVDARCACRATWRRCGRQKDERSRRSADSGAGGKKQETAEGTGIPICGGIMSVMESMRTPARIHGDQDDARPGGERHRRGLRQYRWRRIGSNSDY